MCLLQLASGSFPKLIMSQVLGGALRGVPGWGYGIDFLLQWPALGHLTHRCLQELCSVGLKHCKMGSCKEAFEASLPMRGKWNISPATAPQCAQLHNQYMWWKQTSLPKWPSAEQYFPMPFRAGPWPQSLLFHLSGFSSVQLIHAWLTDVAGRVYGHDRFFLLSSAIVCRELI